MHRNLYKLWDIKNLSSLTLGVRHFVSATRKVTKTLPSLPRGQFLWREISFSPFTMFYSYGPKVEASKGWFKKSEERGHLLNINTRLSRNFLSIKLSKYLVRIIDEVGCSDYQCEQSNLIKYPKKVTPRAIYNSRGTMDCVWMSPQSFRQTQVGIFRDGQV